MTLKDWALVIDRLSEAEQEAFGNICINQDQGIPMRIIKSLKRNGLIEKVPPDGWQVASIAIHCAWCRWCTKKIGEELEK